MHTIAPEQRSYYLIVQGSSLYLPHDELPFGQASELGLAGLTGLVIGQHHDKPLTLVLDCADRTFEFTSLRACLGWDEALFNVLNRGVSLHHFYQTHRFCAKCGAPTRIMQPQESAVECTKCGHHTYPILCPSIIVAVRRGKQILLANHLRHKNEKMYTVLAGFVEPGESLEQTVAREVLEETAIRVKNIHYVGSQPWAFPNSLMIGFLADYESGEIGIQENELADAQWFDLDRTLPQLPPAGTIARKLIAMTEQLYKDEQCQN
ncbi:NAD(+) diphosphatase [Pasteurellaceae bacterium HPA106]|uniref:NAD(+) diphosphatase n=1 Tax=Spirabiliibacterium pneumoniae TaxID=221400 RepID=UPI001AAD26FE|nr:NAD(+) diphosphatase [Spirabiliibacterium pneumoniae]MBE2896249.1 NAD(+) diphosphatase [Spirabiliibacterium pneumoniae]